MATNRTALGVLVGLLVGVAIGAVGAAYLIPTERVASPTLATETATGCVTPPPEHDGWIGQFAADDARVVAVNFTIEHDTPGLDVSSTLTEPSPGRYVLAFTTTPTTEKPSAPTDCQPKTTIVASVSLPSEYRSIAVTVDGEPVTTASQPAGSFPVFRPLDVAPA